MSETPSQKPLEQTGDETRAADAVATNVPDAAGHALFERLGVGGMGEVYRSRDPALERDLAVKVIKTELRGDADAERRFLREARLTGALQHPGIVPIHNLGRLADGRLCYTMKLVRGRTFADILRDEPAGSERLPRLLAIFEKMCQAVAFAHSKGVIHRDLKPANVMVGEFGEVQVMDWGLAKDLHAGAPSTESAMSDAMPAAETETGEWVAESTGLSQVGAAFGTLAYMPPEQARGDWSIVDERADVFALGAILCEVLTGRPPYQGANREEVRRRVRHGEMTEALDRLERCGADAALLTLCRECLAVVHLERPRHAGAVAERLASYEAEVRERLRQTELQRVAAEARASAEAERAREAQARAVAERRARRRTLALAAATLVLILAGVGGWWWQRQQREQADRAVSNGLAQAELLTDQARADPLQTDKYQRALEAARVSAQLADNASTDTRRRAEELIARLEQEEEAARQDKEWRSALLDVRGPREGPKYQSDAMGSLIALAEPTADEQFAAAFRRRGVDVDNLSAGEAVALLHGRPAALRTEVIAALDEWASERRRQGKPKAAERLSELAALLDADLSSKRGELREILARGGLQLDRALAMLSASLRPVPIPLQVPLGRDHRRLRQFVEQTNPATEPILGLLTLARALNAVGEERRAEQLLRAAIVARPQEVVLHHTLGQMLENRQPPRWAEAVECYAAARALRPDLGVNLALALQSSGRDGEGLALLSQLITTSPKNPYLHFQQAYALHVKGQLDEAILEYHRAIALDPQYAPAHNDLGYALQLKGRLDEAIVEYRHAITLDARLAAAHHDLGYALQLKGQLDEAIVEYRQAITLDPKLFQSYNNLGVSLYIKGRLDEAIVEYRRSIALDPNIPATHTNLGAALADKGRLDEATIEYRKAIALDPKFAKAHNNLGNALVFKGRLDEAMAEFRHAIALDPKYAQTHNNYGAALGRKGRLDEATIEIRQAIALDPNYAKAHYTLARIALARRRFDEEIAEYRQAIALNPKFAEAQYALAIALARKGRLDEAIVEFRRSIELDPKLAQLHYDFGSALNAKGQVDEAMAEFRQAIERNPKFAEAHYNLGHILSNKGRLDEGMAEYRQAIRFKPDLAEAHCNLGSVLRQMGRFEESLSSYKRGHELGMKQRGWHHPSAQWVRVAEFLLALDKKLPAILRTEATPANPNEAVVLASMCQQTHKKHYAAAARLYADAFAAEPRLAPQHRYNAARSAVLASAGKGKDARLLPDKVAAMLRRWALVWLRDDLTAYAKLSERNNPQANKAIQQRLAHWRSDADLAAVRDPSALDRLADNERAAWQSLWRDVDELAKRMTDK
jgi:tetratricopeptide (TPR) repeat protein